MLKKLFGLIPIPTEDGAYSPSKLSLRLATSDITDYKEVAFANAYKRNKLRILVVCTEESQLTMANGKKFSTGNHPVEMLVPMLHLRNAGFEFDIYTPTGKPVQIEMWAMPLQDKNVMDIYEQYKVQLNNPKSLADLAHNDFMTELEYLAIYIPGGHGALIDLPTNPHLGGLIKWAFNKDLFHLTICHGPAALLSAKPSVLNEKFIYEGYSIAAFPDAVDRQTPLIGYMPGQLTWFFGEELQKLGITIVSKKADKTVYVDRKLITGTSPKAANNFGVLCANQLLDYLNKNVQANHQNLRTKEYK